MATRLTKLTPEQEALIPVVREAWLAVGLSTSPADRPAAEQGVRLAYEAAGLRPPAEILWLGSPDAGCKVAALLSRDDGDKILAKAKKDAKGRAIGEVREMAMEGLKAAIKQKLHGLVSEQLYKQADQGNGKAYDVSAEIFSQLRPIIESQVQRLGRELG